MNTVTVTVTEGSTTPNFVANTTQLLVEGVETPPIVMAEVSTSSSISPFRDMARTTQHGRSSANQDIVDVATKARR